MFSLLFFLIRVLFKQVVKILTKIKIETIIDPVIPLILRHKWISGEQVVGMLVFKPVVKAIIMAFFYKNKFFTKSL
jgi:hypothetical protein